MYITTTTTTTTTTTITVKKLQYLASIHKNNLYCIKSVSKIAADIKSSLTQILHYTYITCSNQY